MPSSYTNWTALNLFDHLKSVCISVRSCRLADTESDQSNSILPDFHSLLATVDCSTPTNIDDITHDSIIHDGVVEPIISKQDLTSFDPGCTAYHKRHHRKFHSGYEHNHHSHFLFSKRNIPPGFCPDRFNLFHFGTNSLQVALHTVICVC